MATAKIENEVPHVYTAIAKILKSLSVEKGGTLPSNMGGKAYITAVDASAEVKRQFVDNDLVFFPSERVVKHEIVPFKERLNIAVVVEGTYRVVSTVDGSSETIRGVGDGLATGTAVASNIASTNALKNAMLRFFLITEQSVEDAAKNGAEETTPAATKIDRARTTQVASARVTGDATLDQLKARLRKHIGTDAALRKSVNDEMDALKASGLSGVALHEALVEKVGA